MTATSTARDAPEIPPRLHELRRDCNGVCRTRRLLRGSPVIGGPPRPLGLLSGLRQLHVDSQRIHLAELSASSVRSSVSSPRWPWRTHSDTRRHPALAHGFKVSTLHLRMTDALVTRFERVSASQSAESRLHPSVGSQVLWLCPQEPHKLKLHSNKLHDGPRGHEKRLSFSPLSTQEASELVRTTVQQLHDSSHAPNLIDTLVVHSDYKGNCNPGADPIRKTAARLCIESTVNQTTTETSNEQLIC